MSANLSGLTIGSLALSPAFSPDETEYSATTTNATNTVKAVAEDANAQITIDNGGATVENGTAATWSDGENTMTITVKNGLQQKTYTVTVTKS